MALIGYNSKRKNTPPPVESLEIYQDTKLLEIPTGEGHISIRSQLLISMVSVSDGDAKTKSMSMECRKRFQTPSDGEQFRVWRSSDSKSSKREKPVVENRVMPGASKPLKNTSRSKSLSPQGSSDKPKISSMKRSATFSGKLTKSKTTKTSKLNDYRNATIKNETGRGTAWITRFFLNVLTLFMLLLVAVILVWVSGSHNTLPYNHSEVLINTTGLQKYLKHNFFGQRYAIKFLHEILQEELNDEKHKLPLILSFHGGPGVGKTFLAEAITKHLFTNGLDSPCVHNFISSLHIRNARDNVNHDIIAEFLDKSTYIQCPLELFIIDNMEILSPYLVNYISKSVQTLLDSSRVKSIIVIFASTLGEKQIFKMRDCFDAYCYLQTTKMLKKELSLTWTSETSMDVDEIEYNFLQWSTLVAFFPLQRKHVKLCVQHVLQQYLPSEKITDELLERVASEISFVYVSEKGYSSSGCKQVAEKVMLHL